MPNLTSTQEHPHDRHTRQSVTPAHDRGYDDPQVRTADATRLHPRRQELQRFSWRFAGQGCLADAHGRKTAQGLLIEAKLSQGELAKLLATSRESVNKQLACWQRDGIVRMTDGAITPFDGEALQQILEQD